MADPIDFKTGDDGALHVKKLNELEVVANQVVDAVATVGQAVSDAEAAADRAAQGGVYESTTAALEVVPDGGYFSVPSAEDETYLVLYRNVGGAAVEQKAYPSAERVDEVAQLTPELRAELGAAGGAALYVGQGSSFLPIVSDAVGKVLLWLDLESQEIRGLGAVSQSEFRGRVEEILGDLGFAEYVGDGPVYPVAISREGAVVVGWDDVNKRAVIAGVNTTDNPPGAKPLKTLADLLQPHGYNHIIAYGQSLSIGSRGQPAISTSQPYGNMTFAGGPRAWDGTNYSWSPLKPLVEDSVSPAPDGGTNRGETICSGMANYCTTLRAIDGHDPEDFVALASAAGNGGYQIDQLEKGTSVYNTRFLEHVSQAHAIDPDHAVHVVAWLQGENDSTNETPFATYRDKLNQLIEDINSDIAGITGQTSPVYLLTYQMAFGAAAYGEIQLAQLEVARSNPKAFLVTPLYHIPHHGDNVHLTAVGYKWLGGYFGRAYKTLLDGYEPTWLNPVSATRRGRELRVRFDVPVRPLVLDTTTLAATTDYGFAVKDSEGDVAIASIEIDGDDVVITLDADPVGAAVLRYALDYLGEGLTITGAASGNLRDSAPETINVAGIERPLYNVAPHFELSVIALGE